MQLLRHSHPSVEGTFNASKWLKHPFLIDDEEMKALLTYLGEFAFYQVSSVVQTPTVSQEVFLEKYRAYLAALKEGIPNMIQKVVLGCVGASGLQQAQPVLKQAMCVHMADGSSGKDEDAHAAQNHFLNHVGYKEEERKFFSLALSVTPDVFYALHVKEERYLIKPVKPVIQMQAHHFFPSSLDGKFYSMVLSQESVRWGLQCAYPQIFEHPHTYTFSKINSSPTFPNTQLFNKLAKWMRQETVPTTFVWKEQKIPTSFRLGKRCFSWVNTHPQLKEKGITVHVY